MQVPIVDSFFRCSDLKHCARSKFNHSTGIREGSLLTVGKEQTVKVSPSYVCVLQIRNSPRVVHEP
jgi:hypothetical protein